MKKILLVLLTAGLFACQNADQASVKTLTQAEKDSVVKDPTNFTAIQWIDSTFQDLGKVKEGQVVEVSYRFKNAGTKNLVIADVRASCGCTVPEKPEKPIAPNEEGIIKAKFDSKGRSGENRKDVFVTANIPENTIQLSFKVEITE